MKNLDVLRRLGALALWVTTSACDPLSGSLFQIGSLERAVTVPIDRIELGGVAYHEVVTDAVVRDFVATDLGVDPDALGIADFTALDAVRDALVGVGLDEAEILERLQDAVLERLAVHLSPEPTSDGFAVTFDLSRLEEQRLDPGDIGGSLEALIYDTPVVVTAERTAATVGELVGDSVDLDALVDRLGVASLVVIELGLRTLDEDELALSPEVLAQRLVDERTYVGCAATQDDLSFFDRLSVELVPVGPVPALGDGVTIAGYDLGDRAAEVCAVVEPEPTPANVALALSEGAGGLSVKVAIVGELLERPTTLGGYLQVTAAVEDIDESDFGVAR